jgi:hypothetical protein
VGTASERIAQAERIQHRQPVRMEEDASTHGARAVEALEQRDSSAAAGEGQCGDAAARPSTGDDDVEVHGDAQLGQRRPRGVRLERDVANERCRTVWYERVGWCPSGWVVAAVERKAC